MTNYGYAPRFDGILADGKSLPGRDPITGRFISSKPDIHDPAWHDEPNHLPTESKFIPLEEIGAHHTAPGYISESTEVDDGSGTEYDSPPDDRPRDKYDIMSENVPAPKPATLTHSDLIWCDPYNDPFHDEEMRDYDLYHDDFDDAFAAAEDFDDFEPDYNMMMSEAEEAELYNEDWEEEFLTEPAVPCFCGCSHSDRISKIRRDGHVHDKWWARQPYNKGSSHSKSRIQRKIRYGRQHASWRGHFDPADTVRPMTAELFIDAHVALD